MTTQPTPPPQAPAPGGPGVAAFFDRIRRYGAVRPDDGRWFAGVAAGLARRWGVDPLLVRGGFVILALFGGIGFLLYGLGWLFLPHPDGRIHAQEVMRGVVTAGFIGGLLFVLLDLGGSSWSRGGWLGPHPFGGIVLVALVALGVWWFAAGRHRRWGGPGGPGGPGAPGGWGGPGGHGYGGPGWGPTPPEPRADAPGHTPSPSDGSGADDGPRTPPAGDSGSTDIPPYGTPPPPPTSFSAASYPAGPSASSTVTGGYPTGPERIWPAAGTGSSAPVLAPAPPRWAPRPDVQRPSHALTSAVLGAALLGAAVVVVWNLLWGVPGPVGFVAAGVALAVIALGVLAAGVSGRRAGGLAPIGILLAVVTLVGGSAAGRLGWSAERVWTPGALQGTASYTLGVGNAKLDLRQVSAPTATTTAPAEIDARVGVGNLRVIVPSTLPVRIVGSTGAGNIDNAAALSPSSNGSPAPASSSRRGPSVDVDLQTAANPVIVVHADVGLGNLTIDRPNS